MFDQNVLAMFGIVASMFVLYFLIWLFWLRLQVHPRGTPVYRETPPDRFSPASARYLFKKEYDDVAFVCAIASAGTKGYLRAKCLGKKVSVSKGYHSTSSDLWTVIRQDDYKKKDLTEDEDVVLSSLFDCEETVEVSQDNQKLLTKSIAAHEDHLKKELDNSFINFHPKLEIMATIMYLICVSGMAWVIREANFVEGFDFLSGLNATDEKTSEKILQDLKKRDLLLYAEDYPHVYPHCWRSGDELVFKQVNEWYINMDWRDRIKNVVDEINWLPEWGSDSEHNWLDNMGDWMISKKRFWGLALPIWTFKDGSFYVVGSKEELEKLAVEGWDKFEDKSPHRPWIDHVKIKHPETGLIGSRIEDVGNPWLDAGIVPFSTLGYFENNEYWKEWFPADFITECIPGQFRNWFYSLLAMSSFLENKAPFKTLLGHALVKDEDGKEMHKTAGNAIWFDDAAEKMGVDVMRWMYIRQNVENNLLFGYGKADDVRKRLISFWNIYSFFCTYASVDKFEPNAQKINPKDYTLLDKWIIAKVNLLIKESSIHYDRFEADKLLKKVELFIDDLSNWYIRRNRRRFWKSENDKDKFVAYQTLYAVSYTHLTLPTSDLV